METIYKIQALDDEINKLKRAILNSNEQKQLNQLLALMKEGKAFISNTEIAADELLKEFYAVQKDYENNFARSEIVAKQKVDKATHETIGEIVSKTNNLASEFAAEEQQMRNLNDKISRLLTDYNNAMARLRWTKEKLNGARVMLAKMEEKIAPDVAKLQAQIKELEPKADKKMYEKYKAKKADSIFPVFVMLENNRCGGCKMELSLNFIERLKENKMIPCEECHRIIVSE